MPLTIRQMPYRDAGTGEHSQSDGPVTFYADDVDNQPADGTEGRPDSVTTNADDIDNRPEAGGVDREPETHAADWPATAENKTVKPEQADAKSEEPIVTTPKKSTKKGS